MAEKRKTCDACGEEWEESFFCARCSSKGEFQTVMNPNPFWDGVPGEEYVEEEEWVFYGDVCMNCCGCHELRSLPVNVEHESPVNDEGLPF